VTYENGIMAQGYRAATPNLNPKREGVDI